MWLHLPARQNISIVTWFPWCPNSTESGNGVRFNRSRKPFFLLDRCPPELFRLTLGLLKKGKRFIEPNNFSSLTGVSYNNVLSDFVLTKI